jgi:hypothetical protein
VELGEVELCEDPYDPWEPELMLPLLLLLGEVELGSVEVGDVELWDPLVLLGDVELCDPLVLGDVELCEPELMVPLLLLLWGVVLPALPWSGVLEPAPEVCAKQPSANNMVADIRSLFILIRCVFLLELLCVFLHSRA